MNATTATREAALASVIIPSFDQLPFTRLCLTALVRHTRPPWELIVVDNGSTDGTPAYLQGVADVAPVPVRVLTNPENRGFAAACNQGLRAARGEYLVLLNNDAVVTDGWLDQLMALADSDPRIAMVGPMSNYAAPPQLVEEVPYRDLEEMHAFAARWRDEHRGRWFTCEKLSGFCLLIKRRVLEAIGGLDERFGVGFFEDDDLALRARRAGYSLAVTLDLFVHHFGSRTFDGSGLDAEALLQENRERFASKWGDAAPRGQPTTVRPWTGPADAVPMPTRRTRVSLTMIVRDEETNLPACLGSAADLFDEVVVVDTGSTDRTKEIARSSGARVFAFTWVDDFAAARNAALARATGDYAFWLDADDVLDPPEREKLKALLDGLDPADEAAYVVRCACDPAPGESGGQTVVDHVRLFPVREDVRWTYAVHEQILPSLRRAGIPVRWTDVTVRHTGYCDPAVRRRKLGRDEAILRAELADRPGDPFVLFNLGSIAVERQDWPAALAHLRASLAGSAPDDSITRKLYALIARCHQALGEDEAALAACAGGLAIDPDDAELWFRRAVVHRHRGEAATAEACWRKVLGLRRPEKFASVDAGIYGHLTLRNLAALAEERGDSAEAARLWLGVLDECPGDREASACLARLRDPGPAAPLPATGDGWLVPGSVRWDLPAPAGDEGDFAAYTGLAAAWVRALAARTVVALGVRFDGATLALLEGIDQTGGTVWGIDEMERHAIDHPRFEFVRADPLEVADRWEAIDYLHIDPDANSLEAPRRWLAAYAPKARAVALRHSHHPVFASGLLVRELAATGGWTVHEYRGPEGGWTVLARAGEPAPTESS